MQEHNEAAGGEYELAVGWTRRTCAWSQDGDESDLWTTGCGHFFILNDGTPKENGMDYCCFCGGHLEQDSTTEPGRDDNPVGQAE
ncbi:hypothetical protein JKG47_01175 [Acidithiobacillus sp. MC6.1]|nr:hypothetical protein [Acidithiobacillus sp. MC6.1]